MAKRNAQVVLAARPGAASTPTEDIFLYRECLYPSEPLQKGDVLVKALYLSVDPTLRFLMNEESLAPNMQRWEINETVIGIAGIGIVQKSNSSQFQAGDFVNGDMKWPWQLYFIQNESSLAKLADYVPRDKLSLGLSLFGTSGLTSLLAIWEKGHIVPGTNQSVVVSAAAGSCGYLAGQIARLEGAGKTAGICGSDEKCKAILEVGFDVAINYKTENVAEKLKEAFPNGIDIYFDNVGGEISDTVVSQMNHGSHIILCGQISQYNKPMTIPVPIPPLIKPILEERNITRDLFLLPWCQHRFEEGLKQLAKWYSEGKITVKETLEEGLENAGRAYIKMMAGHNVGKQLVHVADP